MIALLALAAAGAACPDAVALAREARQQALAADAAAAEALLADAEAALPCGGVASAEAMGEVWLSLGALRYFEQDLAGAHAALYTARKVAPDLWDPSLGPEIRAEYDRAVARGVGEIQLPPLPRGYRGALDGVVGPLPPVLEVGPHVVQVVDRRGRSHRGEVVHLADNQVYALEVGPLPRQRSPAWLVASGASAAAAVGLGLIADAQTERLEAATSVREIDAAYGRQKATTYACYGLAGASALSLGAYFAF